METAYKDPMMKWPSNKNKLFHGFDISMHSCDDDWSEQGSVSMIQWVNN